MAGCVRVSVIIPTYQRRAALRRALTSLCAQVTAADRYEVIVAIDGSTDGTHEMVGAFSAPYALRVAARPHRGRAAACNAALKLVRGEVVIILDDDMQVLSEFVECHRRHHPPGSRLCVLGAVPVTLNGTSPLAAIYIRANFEAHLAKLAEPEHAYQPRDFYTGNASLRSDVLREVGGFDESFTRYGNEDIDLWLRLRAAGVTFRFDPEALARQHYDKDLRALAKDNVAKGRTAVLLARTHPEVFGRLRLATPGDHSRPWLAVRAILLALTRRLPPAANAVFAIAALLERAGMWRWSLFYRALLDYAFWAGAHRELAYSSNGPEFDRLSVQLHRGPVDLLLHG